MQNTARDIINNEAKIFNECLNLSKANEYNLVLPNTPGEIIYLAALKDGYEEAYKAPLHYIVNKENEFILKMYGIVNYTAAEILPQTDNTGTTIFPTVPIKGIPFVANNAINEKFSGSRWRQNLGLTAEKNKLPQNMPKLSFQTSRKIKYVDKIENIVLVIPEKSANKDFWTTIINYNKRLGYSVIVDSKDDYYKRLEVITTKELGLKFQDIIAIGNLCRYVFSRRCDINDILCGKGKNMYCFYSKENKNEYKSLTKLFDVLESPCEILINNFCLQYTNFEDKNLESELNDFLQAKKEKQTSYEMCAMLFKGSKRKSDYFKYLAKKITMTYGIEEKGEKIYATGNKTK